MSLRLALGHSGARELCLYQAWELSLRVFVFVLAPQVPGRSRMAALWPYPRFWIMSR